MSCISHVISDTLSNDQGLCPQTQFTTARSVIDNHRLQNERTQVTNFLLQTLGTYMNFHLIKFIPIYAYYLTCMLEVFS